jgi:putative transposase
MSPNLLAGLNKILTYRYRLLPTRAQHAALARILEEQRWLYNAALIERQDAYRDPDAVREMHMTLAYRAGVMEDTTEYDRRTARQDYIEACCTEAVETATRPILLREGWEDVKDCPRNSPVRKEIATLRSAARRAVLERERAGKKPKSITNFDQTNGNTLCRNDPLTADQMSRLPAFLQHWTLKRLDDAYKAFYRRLGEGKRKDAGFPKSRKLDRWDSFGFSQNGGFRFDGKRLRFKGLPGGLRLHLHRPLPGDIGTLGHRSDKLHAITLTRDPGRRKWWVCLACDVIPQPRCQSETASVGIDVGVAKAIAQSDAVVIHLPKTIRAARKAKTLRQRAMSRAIKGSKRREKTKLRLARLEAKNTRRRKAWQHKHAARLTRCYRVIGLEDLQVANMVRSAKGTAAEPGTNVSQKSGLNRAILEVGWAGLREKLEYKARRDGATIVPVPPQGTSQTCSACGHVSADNRRTQAVFACGACGHRENADINAAKVIRARALAQVVPVSTGIRGLPQPEGAKGTNGSPSLVNTAEAIPPDGGRNGTSNRPLRLNPPRPVREPQASMRRRGDPRPNDIRQLSLTLPLPPSKPEQSGVGPRKEGRSARNANRLQVGGRTLYRGGD